MGFSIDLFRSKFGRGHGFSNSYGTFFFLAVFCIIFICSGSSFYEILLCSVLYLISPEFTLKKNLSTSSLKRGFRPLHLLKIPCCSESHKASNDMGHILAFLWLYHTEPPGTTNQSGFMATLTTSRPHISLQLGFSDWWHSLHWPYKQPLTVFEGWERTLGKISFLAQWH